VKGVLCTVVLVPPIAWSVARTLELPWMAEVGIMLMAISPGAPLALRRSLAAGGQPGYAPALQIAVAVVAVVSMPLWIAALDLVYAGHAGIAPQEVARQAFVAQLLPLACGMLARRLWPGTVASLHGTLVRVGTVLVVGFIVLAIVHVGPSVVAASGRVVFAMVMITVIALSLGHACGGPQPGTRTAIAISTAARNPGLALLVATLNHASPAVVTAVLAYVIVAALAVMPYLAWRRRAAAIARPAC